MHTLVIVTTQYLDSEDLKAVSPLAENNRSLVAEFEFYAKKYRLFKVDKENVFFADTLKNVSEENRSDFINLIFDYVVKNLTDKTSIKNIKLALHRPELDESEMDEDFKIVEKQKLLDFLNSQNYWQLTPAPKLPEDEDIKSLHENGAYIELAAFKHSVNVFTNFLKGRTTDLYQGTDLAAKIKDLFDREKKLPEKESLQGINLKLKKNLFSNLGITFHFFEYTKDGLIDGTREASPFRKAKEEIEKLSQPSSNRVNVLFLSRRHLINHKLDTLVNISSFFHQKEEAGTWSDEAHAYPLITIGDQDLMRCPNIELSKQAIDRRVYFLDSSIWYRYAGLLVEDFEGDLLKVLETIHWAYKNKLYYKNVTKEYLEFCNRQIANSFLDHSFGGGHASAVLPYTFHSETIMEERAFKLEKSLKKSKLRWNFLLVDDYCNHLLKEGKAKPQEAKGSPGNKKKLIQELIECRPSYHKKDNSSTFISSGLEAVASPKMAIKKIEEDDHIVYDIILLDYLFSLGENGEYNITPKYGTFFLEAIDDNTLTKGKGPLEMYWVFPVTVFPNAMLSDLQGKSLQHFEKNWQLARGADPVNTPHLFRCSLFEFMEVVVRKVLFEEKDVYKFLIREFKNSLGEFSKEDAGHIFKLFIDSFSSFYGLSPKSAIGGSMIAAFYRQADRLPRLVNSVRELLYLLEYDRGFNINKMEMNYEHIYNHYESFFSEPESYQNFASKDERGKLKEGMEVVLKKLSDSIHTTTGKYF